MTHVCIPAIEVESVVVEYRSQVPPARQLAAWLREMANEPSVSKYDAHCLEEAATVLEKMK